MILPVERGVRHGVPFPVCRLGDIALESLRFDSAKRQKCRHPDDVDLYRSITADFDRPCGGIAFASGTTRKLIGHDKQHKFPIRRRLEFGDPLHDRI